MITSPPPNDVVSIQDRLQALMYEAGLEVEAWVYYFNGSIQLDGHFDSKDLKLLAQIVETLDKEYPVS